MSDTYEFKVGDKVLLTSYSGRKISVVEKIPPKGFIKVDGMLFYPNGKERTSNYYYSCGIELLTPELEKEVGENAYRQRITKRLREIKWNDITYEQAQKIDEVLNLIDFKKEYHTNYCNEKENENV